MLGVRSADLLRVHDTGAGRSALPGAFRQAAGDPQGDHAGPARRHRGRQPADEHRHADADRDERRRLLRRARPRGQRRQRHRQHDLRARCALRAARRGGRLVAHRNGCISPLRPDPPGVEHVGPVHRRHAARAGDRAVAIRSALLRLGHRRLGGSAARDVLLAHRRRIRRDLRRVRCAARARAEAAHLHGRPGRSRS